MKKLSVLLLVIVIFLASCGKNPQRAALDSGDISAASDEAGGNAITAGQTAQDMAAQFLIQETAIPDPDEQLLGNLEDDWQLREDQRELIDGVLFRLVSAGDWTVDNGVTVFEVHKRYLQRLCQPYDRWLTFDITEPVAVPAEGEDQNWYIDHVLHEKDGVIYCTVGRRNDANYYLGQCDQDGLSVIQQLELQSEEISACSLWRDPHGNYYFYNQFRNTILKVSEDFLTEDTINLPVGIQSILGLVWNPLKEEVYWYGRVNQESGIWALEGHDVLLKDSDAEGFSMINYWSAIDSEERGWLVNTQELWRYDGEAQRLFRFTDKDYIVNGLHFVETADDGSLWIYAEVDGEDCILQVQESDQPLITNKQQIVMALDYRNVGLDIIIARFNRQNDKYHVSVMLPEEGQDFSEFRDRIQMELSTGGGPDILGNNMVTDMAANVRNGILAPVNELLVNGEQYLPGALEGGMIDESLYGVPYDCLLNYAAYSQSFADGRSSWTMPELMAAVRASDAKVLISGYGGINIVEDFGLSDDENTAYIDWENGISHLTEEPFLELLAFAKEYADGQVTASRKADMLKSGEIAAERIVAHDDELRDINYLKACFDGEPAMLGFPRVEGNGIYVYAFYLYLNNSSKCIEGAKEFLLFMASKEEQERYIDYKAPTGESVDGYQPIMPVNMGAVEHYIATHRIGKNVRMTYDGITYEYESLSDEDVATFRRMLSQAHTSKWRVLDIMDIVSEELEPFFSGSISAQEAARKLDNRVQLYLDEQR